MKIKVIKKIHDHTIENQKRAVWYESIIELMNVIDKALNDPTIEADPNVEDDTAAVLNVIYDALDRPSTMALLYPAEIIDCIWRYAKIVKSDKNIKINSSIMSTCHLFWKELIKSHDTSVFKDAVDVTIKLLNEATKTVENQIKIIKNDKEKIDLAIKEEGKSIPTDRILTNAEVKNWVENLKEPLTKFSKTKEETANFVNTLLDYLLKNTPPKSCGNEVKEKLAYRNENIGVCACIHSNSFEGSDPRDVVIHLNKYANPQDPNNVFNYSRIDIPGIIDKAYRFCVNNDVLPEGTKLAVKVQNCREKYDEITGYYFEYTLILRITDSTCLVPGATLCNDLYSPCYPSDMCLDDMLIVAKMIVAFIFGLII